MSQWSTEAYSATIAVSSIPVVTVLALFGWERDEYGDRGRECKRRKRE